MTKPTNTKPLTLSEALDLISVDRREIPRAWTSESALRSARRLAAEYGFTSASINAERLATIWTHNRA